MLDEPAVLQLAAFYGRVSSPEEESIDNQLTVAKERARRDGFHIPNGSDFIFADVFVSGTTTSRKQFNRLIQLVEDGHARFSRVYVRASDRFGRWINPRLYDYYVVRFEMHGVEIHFCDVERNLDFTEGVSEGDVGLYILGKCVTINDSRARTDLNRKMRRARRTRARDGFYPGGVAPFGFDRVLVHAKSRVVVRTIPRGERIMIEDCHYSLVPQKGRTHDAIRTVFDCLDRGLSMKRTAAELERLGFPSAGGSRWYGSMVGDIAYNPIYMGTLVWGALRRPLLETLENPPPFEVDGKNPVVTHEFIKDPHVSREQFFRVRRILGGNQAVWERRRASAPKYLFSGKIICGYCGSGYSGQKSNSSWVYRHNRSDREEKQACPEYLKALRIDRPDDYFLACIASLVADPNLHDRVAKAIEERRSACGATDIDKRIADLEEEIADGKARLLSMEKERDRMKSESAREASLARSEELGHRVDECKELVRGLQAETDAIKQQSPPIDVARASIATALERLVDGSFTVRRALVDHTVEWVKVRGSLGDVEIALRYP